MWKTTANSQQARLLRAQSLENEVLSGPTQASETAESSKSAEPGVKKERLNIKHGLAPGGRDEASATYTRPCLLS